MNLLSDKTILVTRPNDGGVALCKAIEAENGVAVHFPTIAFAKPKVNFQHAIEKLGEQSYLIFISPQAVRSSIAAIKHRYAQFPWKIAAVGAGTARVLQEAGFNVDVYPQDEWSSEGLLALPCFQHVAGMNIAVVRGEGGRLYIDNVLAERGANVLPVICYQRMLPEVSHHDVDELMKTHFDVIVCGSFETVKNLQQILGKQYNDILIRTPIIVMSERVKQLAETLGFQTIWVTQNASNNAVINTLKENIMHENDEIKTEVVMPAPKQARKKWVPFLILLLIIFIAAAAYGYVQMAHMNMSLQNKIANIDMALNQTTNHLNELKTQVSGLKDTQAEVDDIKKSLASAILEFQNNDSVDVTAVFTKLVALDEQIVNLPLQIQTYEKNIADAHNVTTWWQKALNQTLHSLSKIVVVKKQSDISSPLIMPDEKTFLYLNLHAQIENAKWAVIHKNITVYQSSLQQTMHWIHKYFAQDSKVTTSVLAQLDDLMKINVSSSKTNLSTSLKKILPYTLNSQSV